MSLPTAAAAAAKSLHTQNNGFFLSTSHKGRIRKKKNLMMPGKITITSKRIGIFPLEMGVNTPSLSDTWERREHQNRTRTLQARKEGNVS